jgi:hypothetical protein
MNTTLEYSTRVVQEGDRRCKKSTLNDLAYLTPLRIPLMKPVNVSGVAFFKRGGGGRGFNIWEEAETALYSTFLVEGYSLSFLTYKVIYIYINTNNFKIYICRHSLFPTCQPLHPGTRFRDGGPYCYGP